MSETTGEAYDRGVSAGRIEERLERFDRHFADINGSQAETARALQELSLQVQRLADQAAADARTRVSTADAIEKARKEAAGAIESERQARADRSSTAWSPVQKALAVLAGIATVVATVVALAKVL